MFKLIDITKLTQFWVNVKSCIVGAYTDQAGEIFNDYSGNTAAYGAHAEGAITTASGILSHAECYSTTASGDYSHAEGNNSTASGEAAHAEGEQNTASAKCSHAEGYKCEASGQYTHAEGWSCIAKNFCSHAEGNYTTTDGTRTGAHVEGCYNTAINNAIHTVGNGTAIKRKNAHVIMFNGKHYIPGIGGYAGTETDLTDIKDLATVINEILERLDANE